MIIKKLLVLLDYYDYNFLPLVKVLSQGTIFLLNHKAVGKTAQATPGLILKTVRHLSGLA